MRAGFLVRGLAAAALLLGTTFSAHAEDALARVKAAGSLKVGTETAFAPFDFIDAGEHAGLNVDVFAEIGKELGVTIEWVALPWEGVLPGLEAGKFDMVAGPATITKARMERYIASGAWRQRHKNKLAKTKGPELLFTRSLSRRTDVELS